MKRISAYQATDGSLFDDKKACAEHQRKLNTKAGLLAIGQAMEGDYDFLCNDLGNEVFAITTPEQLALFIEKHAENIKLALAGKFVADGEDNTAVDLPGELGAQPAVETGAAA